MKLIAIDTETALIRSGRAAPELACVTWAGPGYAGISHWTECRSRVEEILSADVIVGQNVAFDFAVLSAQFPDLLPRIFEVYQEGRVRDTLLRQQLLDIADGSFRGYVGHDGSFRKREYGLAALHARHGLGVLPKDEWRLGYGQLRDLPLDQWPEGAKGYAIKDAVATLQIFGLQGGAGIVVPDEIAECEAFFCLQLSSVWGLRTNAEGVARLRAHTEREVSRLRTILLVEGLVRADGSRDTKTAQARMAAAWALAEEKPRLTPTGKFQLDDDACRACGDEIMEAYAELSTQMKVLGTDVPMLEAAAHLPIHPGYKLLETTRIGARRQEGMSGGNTQNLRRAAMAMQCGGCGEPFHDKHKTTQCAKCGIKRAQALDVRECFVPREGWAYVDVDYPALEMRTFAEVLVEWGCGHTLANALNEGIDPHCVVAAQILGVDYEEAKARVKGKDHAAVEARQAAKVANFGYPGGLGAARFVDFARRSYGVEVTEQEAVALKDAWRRAWPEVHAYFGRIRDLQDPSGAYKMTSPKTGVVRAGMTYTAACNHPFQHLGAAVAKRGLVRVTRACYLGDEAPIKGARVVNMIHDQVLVEVPYVAWGAKATHLAAYEIARLFAEGAQSYLRCVTINVEPLLTSCWSKRAEPVFDEEGRLVPWRP